MLSAGYKTLVVPLVASAAITGCTGSGAGLDANGNPLGSGGNEPLTATFKSIQDNIFTPICTKCHSGASAPQGLQLDAAHSYSLLVGISSAEQPGVLRVKAGDPDSSYIIQKLEGSPGISGVQMPFGGPYLPQSTIDVIRAWIAAGAAQSMAVQMNAAAHATERFVVAMTAPENESVVPAAVRRIVVAFNRELNASVVNDDAVMLEKIGGATLPVSVALAPGNPATLVITPSAPLAVGSYRVRLHGTGGDALADVSARALEGDYSFTFAVDTAE